MASTDTASAGSKAAAISKSQRAPHRPRIRGAKRSDRSTMPTGLAAVLHEEHPACPQSVGRLRHAVVEFAGRSGATAGQCAMIALAVSEAVNNAVMHAYVGHEQAGIIAVDAQVQEHALEVIVSDQGNGMRPRSDSPGVGLGLPLIARLTEKLQITDATPGVCVHMTFAIARP